MLKSVNCRFVIFYHQPNIWERFTPTVSSWEHCGIKSSNTCCYIVDNQCGDFFIRVQNIELDNLLVDDACRIIETARDYAYRAVNTALTIRNWQLGERIAREHLEDNGRAEYGKQVMVTLATVLTEKYGKGFDRVSLYNYIRFYNMFPEIVDSLRQQSGKVDAVSPQLLPWTLYRELIRVEDATARKWYEQEAMREMWSSRTLHRNIGSQYYYRLMQSPAKDKVVAEMHQVTEPMQDKLEFIKSVGPPSCKV